MTAARGPAEAAGETSGPGRIRSRISLADVLTVAAPTGVLTGILYYFGYVSTRAYYAYFGVSLSALDLPTSSYLISDAQTFFKPAATLLIALIVLFAVHRLLAHVLHGARERWARWVVLILVVAALVLAVFGLAGLYGPWGDLWSALALAAAGLVLEYSIWMAPHYAAAMPAGVSRLAHTGVNLRRGLVIALVVTAAFWATTDLAYQQGMDTASLVQLSLPLQSQAVVYSADNLHLPVPAQNVTALGGKDTAYHFRYNGTRRAGGSCCRSAGPMTTAPPSSCCLTIPARSGSIWPRDVGIDWARPLLYNVQEPTEKAANDVPRQGS
jgi:hypothetical protein